MSDHLITLNLPDAIYEQIRQAAEKAHRSVGDVLVEAVSAAAPCMAASPENLRSALAQMAYLNDAALWQAARATMSAAQRDRLAALHDQKQRRKLSVAEEQEEKALLGLYRDTLLVRAQAAVLLKQRGYDVSDPEQFAPLA